MVTTGMPCCICLHGIEIKVCLWRFSGRFWNSRCGSNFGSAAPRRFCYLYHSKGCRETEVNGLDLSEHGAEGYIL
jgi:hypothetical protein